MSVSSSTFYRVLRSPSLAVAVLLALAVLAAAGTFFTPADSALPPGTEPVASLPVRLLGLQHAFRSPLFLALVLVAALNVGTCSWHRLSPRVREGCGARQLTDLLIHASLLLVLAGGALKGWLGFVGTQNVHVGGATGTLYDWRAGRDEGLGFEIRVEEFREVFYPIRARVGLLRAGTEEKLGRVDLVEGGEAAAPGGELRLRIERYDSAAGAMSFSVVTAGGVPKTVAFRTREGEGARVRAGAYDLVLVAFRADPKEARARVSVVEKGTAVATGWLSSNTNLSHRGLALSLTGWGADAEGNRFCGIQGVRDPGAPLFWAGCVLLALAIPAHFLAKHRRRG